MKLYLADPDSGTAGWEKIWGALAAAALAAVWLLPLDRLGVGFCPLRAGTGIPCFLCGGTRGFVAAAHFDFAAAWGHNPFALFLFLGILAYLPYATGAVALSWRRPRLRFESDRERNLLRLLAVGAIGLNWGYLLLS